MIKACNIGPIKRPLPLSQEEKTRPFYLDDQDVLERDPKCLV